jgi:23S rRNA (cytidine1920-2'-O)/16S rRNA (cytidine1409-2'-O)-methyltransferase
MATLDLSFISLRLVLPVVVPLVARGGTLVVLVKPQFEAGPGATNAAGLVTSDEVCEGHGQNAVLVLVICF